MCPPVWAIRMGPQIFYHVSTVVECEFLCRWPSVWIFWCLYMIRLRLFMWATMPQKWCVSTVLIRTLSFTHKEITFRMMSHLALDLTHLFPAHALHRFTAHSSWLWTWPFSAWFCLGTWGPLRTRRVSEHPPLAISSLSVFLVGFVSLPFQENLGEMTVLCLVPEPCPRVVDAQRNTTNYEWASEWLPSWPGCLPSILPLETMELSTISTVLFFPCHVIGIILYVAFSEGLLSLSNMHLKLLHVFSWLNSSLIFSADLYSIVWVYHSLFIHSLLKDILVVFKFQ